MSRKERRRQRVKRLGLVLGVAIEEAIRELPDATPDERRDWIVELLNSSIDAPLLNERQEAIVLGLLVDVVRDILRGRRYDRSDIQEAAEFVESLKP